MKIYILCLIIFIVAFFIKRCYNGVKNFEKNNSQFYVTKNMNKEKISIILEIKNRINKLFNYLRKEYSYDTKVRKLLLNFSGEIEELENNKNMDNVFAYNLNKGSKIAICLQKNKNELNDINELMFVIIHELAHVMTEEYKHNTEFWNSYKFLLKHSINLKIYKYKNYNQTSEPFCRKHIMHNPL